MGTRKYPPELRERAVRLYRESDPKPVIRRLAEQLNVHPEALRNWIRHGRRPLLDPLPPVAKPPHRAAADLNSAAPRPAENSRRQAENQRRWQETSS